MLIIILSIRWLRWQIPFFWVRVVGIIGVLTLQYLLCCSISHRCNVEVVDLERYDWYWQVLNIIRLSVDFILWPSWDSPAVLNKKVSPCKILSRNATMVIHKSTMSFMNSTGINALWMMQVWWCVFKNWSNWRRRLQGSGRYLMRYHMGGHMLYLSVTTLVSKSHTQHMSTFYQQFQNIGLQQHCDLQTDDVWCV